MEDPSQKRLRKCGVKRKRRENPDAAAQSRAFKKKRKMGTEAKALRDVLDQIQQIEDKRKMLETLRDNRRSARLRVQAEIEELKKQLANAEAFLAGTSEPDMSDIDERDRVFLNQIETLKQSAKAMTDHLLTPEGGAV